MTYEHDLTDVRIALAKAEICKTEDCVLDALRELIFEASKVQIRIEHGYRLTDHVEAERKRRLRIPIRTLSKAS